MLVWDILTTEQYKRIIKGESVKLNIPINENDLINQLSNPIIEELEVTLNTYEYIQLKQLRKINCSDVLEHFKALSVVPIKAKDALNTVRAKIAYSQRLDEEYIELYNSDDSEGANFSSEFIDRFTWLILISEICKEFNLSLIEVYNLPAEDFLQFSLYLKGKREYETQQIKRYRNG